MPSNELDASDETARGGAISQEMHAVQVDPSLGVDEETSQKLAQSIEYVGPSVVVFMTSFYPAMLAAERVERAPGVNFIFIRLSGFSCVSLIWKG